MVPMAIPDILTRGTHPLTLAAFSGLAWFRWLLASLALAFSSGQSVAAQDDPVPASCAAFLGHWAGQWSQGFYGTQYIDVTSVSPQCVATLAYRPTEAPASKTYQVPIRDGVIEFGCNVPGSTCRIEIANGALRFTYTETSGFVNIGTFLKKEGLQ